MSLKNHLKLQHLSKKLFLLFFFVFISIGTSSAYLFLPDYFQSLDDRVRDFYFKFHGPTKTSTDITIVDIDEKSIKELGQWPWERDKIATILQNLSNNGAGIIGLDIIFSEKDKSSPKYIAQKWGFDSSNLPDYDKILATTIKTTPTILGFIFDFNNKNSNEAPNIPAIFLQKHKQKDALPQAKGVLTNLNILQNSAYSSGYLNNIPDVSGMIRSVPLFIAYDMEVYPSLAIEMYRLALNTKKVILSYDQVGIDTVQIGHNSIPTDRFGKMYINFHGPAKSYKYISATDVYHNNIHQDNIKNKFIFLGTSAYGLMDLRSTPLDSVIPGVEIHANMLDNLLNHDMLHKPNWSEIANLSIIIFTSFIVLFILSRFNILTLTILFIIILIGIFSFNYYMLFYQHIILNSIFPLIALFLSLISLLAINYIFEFRQKEIVKQSFSKKVSKQVMDDLLKNPNSRDLSSKEVETTIYFSDIRSFTSISEKLASPKRITDFLNFYMNIMVKAIEANKGTIDKFIGDAIMAYWNAPIEIDKHADKAVTSALIQIKQRDQINKIINKNFGFDVDYGIGINTGNVVVGEIGSKGRSDYTIIGDAVNLASRLEGLCKPYKVRLVISEFTKELLEEEYIIQFLDKVRVKGKHEPVKIYEVIALGKANKEKLLELQRYEEAHSFYHEAHFTQAQIIFEELYKKYGKFLYNLYALRCEQLLKQNIKDFDGVFEFTTK